MAEGNVDTHRGKPRERRDHGDGGHGGPGGQGGPPGRRGPAQAEEELATKMLVIQAKRFYLDVKQNARGRFIKIAEVGAGGRKARIVMSMPAAAEFRDHLTEFSEFYASLGPANAEALPEGGRLKSENMIRENRRYYLDLKENERGRFLRVTQAIFHGPRNVIVIPAQGLVEFRDALTKQLDEFGQDDMMLAGQLPEGKRFRAENKMFYLDIGQNNRGVFMRISEVKQNYRASITVPERAWTRFRDAFAEICEEVTAKRPEPEVSDDEDHVAEDAGDDIPGGEVKKGKGLVSPTAGGDKAKA